MRTFLFLLSITFFSFTTENSFSQEKVTIDVDKVVPIDEVFNIIQKQTKYRFLYPQDLFSNMPNVQLRKGVIQVSKLLEQSLAGSNFNFKLSEDNTIVIKENNNDNLKIDKVQQHQVSGTIKDELGQPLPDIIIQEKGTNNAVKSDIDGKFSITLKSSNAVLVVSFLGFVTQEIVVYNQTNIKVILREYSTNLNEVVVVGYGTQKKATLTGSVSVIKSEEILQTKTANLANNLTGRVAGLFINSRGGEPGSDDVNVLIRGKGTTGDSSPLYVVDGIANRGSFERMNPDDIESISVLKDASAAIYGAQAANGVILVTTKRGKEGKTKISYNQTYSFAQPTRRPYLMDAQQYLTWIDEQNVRNGRPAHFQDIIKQYENGTNDPKKWGNTDWWAEVMDSWTPQVQHELNVNGGSQNIKFYLSGQYLDQDALYKGDAYGYKQYNTRSNIDAKISQNLGMGFDLALTAGNKVGATQETSDLVRQVFLQNPYELPYFSNGLVARTLKGNPINLVNGDAGSKTTKTNKLESRFFFRLDMPFITKGLYIYGYAAVDYYTSVRKDFTKPYDQYEYNDQTGEYINLNDQTGNITLFQQFDENLSKTYHLRSGYDKKIGKHSIGGFVAAEEYKQVAEYFYASRNNLISEDIPYLFSGSDVGKDNGGSGYQSARRNFFGRLNYNYDEKYLAEFTYRYDGSANFAEENRYGSFPGASLGWRLSKESFFKSELISDLKLRASWGKLGNDRVPNFQYLQYYNIDDSYIFGENPIRTIGLTPGTTANPNITWETAEKTNLGLDFKMRNGLLEATLEAFYENRSDILAPRNASVPIYTGFTLPDENIGKVINKGFELQLNHRYQIRKFKYNVGGQFSYAKNEIKFIDEAENTPEWQKRTGSSLDYILVYQADGLYQDLDEIRNSAHFPDAKPGDVKFVDKNNDGKIDNNDKILLKDSPTPKIVYGITVGFEWQNLAVNMFFQGQAKAQTLYRPWDLNQQSAFFEDRWISKETTPNAHYPAAYDMSSSSIYEPSTIWAKDNSFLRMKNIEISYSFEKYLIKQIGLENLRLFVAGNNLFFIYDKAKINDPESISSTGWYYPQQKLISMGLNLTF